MDQEEIRQLGLTEICPKRTTTRGWKPKITRCGTEDDKTKRYEFLWRSKEEIDLHSIEDRTHFCYVYNFDNELRKQKEGEAIGLELTGLLARIYTV